MSEPTHYAFTNTGVFVSYNGTNFAINTTANAIFSNLGSSIVINSSSIGFANSTGYIVTYLSRGGFTSDSQFGFELGSTTAINTPFIDFHSSGNVIDFDSRIIASGGNSTIGQGGLILYASSIAPGNSTQDFGTASQRWRTIYTQDLSLNNGIGDWTIVEGEDDLFLYNNKKGKVYKFNLTEVDPAVATPKKS